MSIISDFTSLFEIGVGLGVGLSLFRMPVDNRKTHLIRRIEEGIELFKHGHTTYAKKRYEEFSEISIRLHIDIISMEQGIKHHPIVMLIGALMNFTFLVISAFDPNFLVSIELGWFFVFIAIGWYGVAAVTLLYMVNHHLGPVARDLIALETKPHD